METRENSIPLQGFPKEMGRQVTSFDKLVVEEIDKCYSDFGKKTESKPSLETKMSPSPLKSDGDGYVDYFSEILQEMSDVHERKNADYGNNFHKRFKRWGFITALLRLSDKMERLENIYEKGQIEVKDESVEDTLLDLANYAVMTLVELRNQKMG